MSASASDTVDTTRLAEEASQRLGAEAEEVCRRVGLRPCPPLAVRVLPTPLAPHKLGTFSPARGVLLRLWPGVTWGRLTGVLLHELAHAKLAGSDVPSHGLAFERALALLAWERWGVSVPTGAGWRAVETAVVERLEREVAGMASAPWPVSDTERERLVARVRHLLALSRDTGSPNEAAIAASLAVRLMDEHDITEALACGERGHDAEDRPVVRRRLWCGTSGQVPSWLLHLTGVVTRAHGCTYVYRSGRFGSGWLDGVGDEDSLARTSEMLAWLIGEVEHLWQAERKKPGARGAPRSRTVALSFRLGVVSTVGARLDSERASVRKEARDKARAEAERTLRTEAAEQGDEGVLAALDAGGEQAECMLSGKHALARVEHALAFLDRREERARSFVSGGGVGKVRRGGERRHGLDAGAYGRGVEAGKRASLRGGRGKLEGSRA